MVVFQQKLLHRCEWKCVNMPGTYRCICSHGYRLHLNGHQCDGQHTNIHTLQAERNSNAYVHACIYTKQKCVDINWKNSCCCYVFFYIYICQMLMSVWTEERQLFSPLHQPHTNVPVQKHTEYPQITRKTVSHTNIAASHTDSFILFFFSVWT